MRKINNRLKNAISLKEANRESGKTIKNKLTRNEGSDLFRLDVTELTDFDLRMFGLKGDLDIEIYKTKRKLRKVFRNIGKESFEDLKNREIRKYLKRINKSTRKAKKDENLDEILEPGTYFIRIFANKSRNQSKYKLRYSLTDIENKNKDPEKPEDEDPKKPREIPERTIPQSSNGGLFWADEDSIFSDSFRWDPYSFIPAWEAFGDGVDIFLLEYLTGVGIPLKYFREEINFQERDFQEFLGYYPITFDTSLSSGKSYKYLPFYISSLETSFGVREPEFFELNISDHTSPIKFSKETYVIERDKLNLAGNTDKAVPDLGDDWFLVDEENYPDNIPKLEVGGNFLSTTVIIVNSIDSLGEDNTFKGKLDSTYFGSTGNDTIIAEELDNDNYDDPYGSDLIEDVSYLDRFHGGEGNDEITGGLGPAFLYGGAGDDILVARKSLRFFDDFFERNLYGGTGNDELYGWITNDILDGGIGIDYMEGGKGDDAYYIDNLDDVVAENFGEGDDVAFISIPEYKEPINNVEFIGYNLVGTNSDDTLNGGNSADKLYGGAGNDVIKGNGTNKLPKFMISLFSDGDRLYGESGDDSITGGNGNDILDGGSGADSMEGGDGDDTYYVDNLADLVIETSDGGKDTVISLIAGYPIPENVENFELRLLGSDGHDSLNGEKYDDRIYGENGNDLLAGGAGDDYLNGGVGNDTLSGESDDDYLDGGDGNDYLLGGAGDDYLTGGSGADVFHLNSPAEGIDVILDFSHAEDDKIRISEKGFNVQAGEFDRFIIKGSGLYFDNTEIISFEDGIDSLTPSMIMEIGP